MATNYTLFSLNFNVIHVFIIMGLPLTLTSSIALLYILRKRSSFMRRECGKQIHLIVIASFIVGLSSIPHLVILFVHGNAHCPQRLLAFMALPRVFTMRFEITQYTWLAVDRAVTTTFFSSYHKQAMVISYRYSIGVPFVLSIADVCFYIFRSNFNYYVRTCSIAAGASPLFLSYFFLVNMISYGIIIAGTIIYGVEITSNVRSNSRTTYSMIRLVFYLLSVFSIVVTVPSILIIIQQLTQLLSLRNYTVFYDVAMNVMHCALLALLIVFERRTHKPKTLATSTTSMVATINTQKFQRQTMHTRQKHVKAPVAPPVVLPNVVESEPNAPEVAL